VGSRAIDPSLKSLLYLGNHHRDRVLHGMQLGIRVKRLVTFEQELEQLKRPSSRHVFEAGCGLVCRDPLLVFDTEPRAVTTLA
jgi:hypothetical protein